MEVIIEEPAIFTDDEDESENINLSIRIYVDIAISTEQFVTSVISKREKIPDTLVNRLSKVIDEVTIIYHGLETLDSDVKYDVGIVLNDLKNQMFRIEQYMFKMKRLTPAVEAKIEAYEDPEIAAYAELTKDGLKTRNRFYKR